MSQTNFKISNPFQIGLLGGLGVLSAVVIGSMVTTLANVITYVFAALFIALGLDPVVAKFEKRGIKRAYGIAIVMGVFLGALTAIGLLVAPELVKQTTNLVQSAPGIIASFNELPWLHTIDKQLGGAISNALTSVSNLLANSSNWAALLGGVVQVGLSILNGITGGLIIVILSLYFMASLKSFKRWLYGLVAASKREQFSDIAEQIFDSIGRYVIGQVSIAFFNACFILLVMLILNVPFAVVLGFIAFLLAMIPLVGSLTAAAIITLTTLWHNPTSALIIAVAYLAYMQFEAYFISPRIMSKAVSVPGAMVVIAALAGGALLGVLGALVAIPIAASLILILRQVWIPRQQKR
ncbi:MAG: hypothetical protein RL556_176 [Actinomycetota bacterium]|jgi:predicted PurR-regulated permease PerM